MDNEIPSEDQQQDYSDDPNGALDGSDELPAQVRVVKDEKEIRKRWDDLVERIRSGDGPSPLPEES